MPAEPTRFSRSTRMLRSALGPHIGWYLEDPDIVEVMLNPDGRLWIDRLSSGLEDTGRQVPAAVTLPEVAQPHMEELVAKVNESSSISVLDDIEIVYVVRVPTRRIMSITIAVGTRLPAYATSMGRVLLAGLPDAVLIERLSRIDLRPLTPRTTTSREALRVALEAVRKQDYAAVDQELEEGLRSLAVPIRDGGDHVIAALNVSVHASRASMAVLRRDFLPFAREAVAAIEFDLRRAGTRGAAFTLPEA